MKHRALFTLAVLVAVNTLNFFDRQVLGAVGEAIRREFGFSDTMLGALGTAFTLLYAIVGVPFGRMADRWPRKPIIAAGVFVWSLLTAVSGLAHSCWQLFALRLGIGVGEATCSPAASSIIGSSRSAPRACIQPCWCCPCWSRPWPWCCWPPLAP